MTYSKINNKYIKVLEEVGQLDKEPVGLTEFTTSVVSSNIPIRQNNLIIQLILNLAKKVDQLEEQITEINQVVHNTTSKLPKDLVDKLENLTLGNNPHRRKSRINPFDNSKWNSLEEKEKK